MVYAHNVTPLSVHMVTPIHCLDDTMVRSNSGGSLADASVIDVVSDALHPPCPHLATRIRALLKMKRDSTSLESGVLA
jgi:hypothetical protein